MKKICNAVFLFIVLFNINVDAQTGYVQQVELKNFSLQSSAVITATGNILSTLQYHSPDYWFPVKVPSTVLTGLVANHVYPDPYIGMNNMLIPDASDSFNHQYNLGQYSFLPNEPNPWKKPYWYRTEFDVPASDKGKQFQLIFKGINYRAAVWLNGQQIADSSQMVGMFEEFDFDVRHAIKAGEKNVLAVEIYPLDFPGLPSHPQLNALGDFYANGGPTGDIGKNVTMLCSVGWDWMPAVRDRNMGIWQPVYLRISGGVVIQHPQIITDLPNLPDTTLAKLSLHLSLGNLTDENQSGHIRITISPETFSGASFTIDRAENVPAGDSKQIDLTANDIKELVLHHPHLWWPNGYGNPDLYRIRLQYISGNNITDDTSFLFGVRMVSSKAVNVNGWVRRDFYVNGERIHITGGAWVPDMMLNRDSTRYDYELHLCRNSNINLVRIWGGGIAPPDVFFEMADKYGLLVWQDFWITGDTNGGFKGSADWPLQGDVYIKNIISTILRIRNHPSLLVWTGGNEGHARQELYDAMRNNVATLDGTRPFIPSSSGFSRLPSDWKQSWPDDQKSGVYSSGPYSWQDADEYYKLVDRGRDWVFKDETGIPSQSPYETLPKIINNLVPDSSLPYPLNNTWGYHDACVGNGHYDTYYDAMAKRYGKPVSMQDFSEKMQLVNANGYRGIFEAAEHKITETGGVMLWKLNAALPSVIWQVYDWYLEPNAGYYFMQNACETIHVQLNLDDSMVAVINHAYHPEHDLTVEASVINLDGKILFNKTVKTDIPDFDAKEVMPLASVLSDAKDIVFVVLNVKDAAGKLLSHNVYWMQPDHDFTGLKDMPEARVEASILKTVKTKTECIWTIRFSNPSSQLAFFVNPQMEVNGEEVLPSFWSTNYFSLASHEDMTVTVSCPLAKLDSQLPVLKISGWNVSGFEIPTGK